MSFMSFFDAIASFPQWLKSFDELQIPAWAIALSITIALVGFVFAIREFLSWFLKTNSIVDEVVRLEQLVRDLQTDLNSLEATVARMQTTAMVSPEEQALPEVESSKKAESKSARKFRLDV